MVTGAHQHLRADAVRNSERVVRAAREVFAGTGPGASLEEVALRAGVSSATLYRRFPDRAALLRAVLKMVVAQDLSPDISAAAVQDDPLRGLVAVLEAVLAFIERERTLVGAAADAGVLFIGASEEIVSTVTRLVEAAQRSGGVRADLVAQDVPRLLLMLVSVLQMDALGASGWRRCLRIVLDGLSPDAASPLEPARP